MQIKSKTYGEKWAYFPITVLPEVAPYRWCVNWIGNTFYCSRQYRDANGNKKVVYLHQVVCPCEPGFVPDHLDRDGLNCGSTNLQAKPLRSNHHNILGCY